MEIVPYGGWNKCVRLAAAISELLITAEVGPRIIPFGLVGGPNEFVEYPDQVETGGGQYRIYGGQALDCS
ncbi:MAG: hypothetical protein H0W86_04840 [Armatimonadetes bacterium]|nr:hypothetical protein [Armatimonadota bacterium]